MDRIQNRKLNTSKGFTLVELIVVLVIMAILAAVGVAGILAWQDWSRFKKENTAAETIFYAMESQLTELDSTGAYDRVVLNVLSGSSSLIKAKPEEHSYFNSNIVNSDGDYYRWDSDEMGEGPVIWANTPSGLSAADKEKYQGRIYVLSAKAGDYDTYLSDPSSSTLSVGTKLLFDLITPYISDKSVLNGAIWAEFSPEAAQVFSVSYSDRIKEFSDNPPSASDAVDIKDRSEDVRRKALIGYFCADSLSMPLEGRSKKIVDNVVLKNDEVLHLVITDDTDKISSASEYLVTIYPALGSSLDRTKPLAVMKVKLTNCFNIHSASQAAKTPIIAETEFKSGVYAGEDKEVRLPVWLVNDVVNQKTEIHIVLDAADVQAQSYLAADKSAPAASFINTYSFYRFGFDEEDSRRIGCVVMPSDSTDEGESNTECPTFGTGTELSEGKWNFEITNGRHLYNVRFETDYKEGTEERRFLLKSDIDWQKFTGKSNGGENYFFDSYTYTAYNSAYSGINYDGLDHSINKGSNPSEKNTQNYAFPGFKSLGIKDEFTGLKETSDPSYSENNKYYTLSNLEIYYSANMAYGVYGEPARNSWNNNPTGNLNYGEYTSNAKGAEANISHQNAMKGLYPLGLFAENAGNINHLALNRHKVIGMEEMNVAGSSEKAFVFTNMVGGFTGDNLGEMSHLILRDVNDLSSANSILNEAGVTHINGKTDVGGILGRESWTLDPAKTQVSLSDLENYGCVTGMENVGGIVGRAYVIRDFQGDGTGGNTYYSHRAYYYNDGYDIYGTYSADGILTQKGKSITGREVTRIEKLTIKDCVSKGRVSGDDYIYNNNRLIKVFDADDNTDMSNSCYRCAFIGGIAGITMDGYYIDHNNLPNGHFWYDKFIADHEERKVVVEDCKAYRLYENGYYNALISSQGALNTDGTISFGTDSYGSEIKNRVEHDYYVGSLVGYARLTSFKNCSNKADDSELNGVMREYVFGRNYVGGLFGCFDQSEILKPDDADVINENNKQFNIENNSNVIGIMYVGGFAGGAGIGDGEQETLSFRHPAYNEGSAVSQIQGDAKSRHQISDILNRGIVLSIRREALNTALYDAQTATITRGSKSETIINHGNNKRDADGGIGGVVGITRLRIKNADNIQSDTSKAEALNMIGFGSNVAYAYSDSSKPFTSDQIDEVRNYSLYGGIGVGGIAGKILDGASINSDGNTSCMVNAVVYGFDAVGGAFGGTQDNINQASVRNVYCENSIIIGRDMVGGLAGKTTYEIRNTDAYKVKNNYIYGRYSVGGVVGHSLTTSSNGINVAIVDSSVTARSYAGGYVGQYSGTKLFGSVTNVDVSADYFAGGIIGAVYNASENANNVSLGELYTSGSNTTVNARVFAGGFAGLYAHCRGKQNTNDIVSGNKLWDMAENMKGKNNTDAIGVVKSHQDGGALKYASADSFANRIRFNSDAMPTAQKSVKAEVFAGGLFGYIPDNTRAVLECMATTGGDGDAKTIKTFVQATSTVDACALDPSRTGLSYSGGITGRVPGGLTLTNASYAGEQRSESAYLGEICEINHGTITGCFVNTMTKYNETNPGVHTIVGGITGSNEEGGVVTLYNSFAEGTVLYGKSVIGGLIGCNRASFTLMQDDSEPVSFSDAKALYIGPGNTGTASYTGLIIGENRGNIDINQKNTGSVVSSYRVQNSNVAGVYAGVNYGTITDSSLSGVPSSSNGEDSLNAVLFTKDVNYAGIITGTNDGTISGISLSNQCILDSDGTIGNSGGIAGYNKKTLSLCFNYGTIGSDKITNSAGIVGLTEENVSDCRNLGVVNASNSAAGIAVALSGDNKGIINCINSGTVSGAACSAGIAASTGVNEYFENCINLGAVSNSNGNSAGIAANCQDSRFEFCRNYSSTVQYGIAAGSVTYMHKCLEAGGKTALYSGATPATCVRNFYIDNTAYSGAVSAPGEGRTTQGSQSGTKEDYTQITFDGFKVLVDKNFYDGWDNPGAPNYEDRDGDNVMDKLEEIINDSNDPYYNLLTGIYVDIVGNASYHNGSLSHHNAAPFNEFMYGVLSVYILQPSADGSSYARTPKEWHDEVFYENGDSEIRNFLAFVQSVIDNDCLPNIVTTYNDGTSYTSNPVDVPVEDNSAYPQAFYEYVDGNGAHGYVYKRFESYFDSGFAKQGIGLLPTDIAGYLANADTDRIWVIDNAFASLANDEENHPDYDVFDGNSALVKQGFVKTP